MAEEAFAASHDATGFVVVPCSTVRCGVIGSEEQYFGVQCFGRDST